MNSPEKYLLPQAKSFILGLEERKIPLKARLLNGKIRCQQILYRFLLFIKENERKKISTQTKGNE